MASDSLVDIAAMRDSPARHSDNDDGDDDVDSLPSISTADLYSEPDSESDAQAEWERSMEQLQLLLTMILVPWVGKLLGRKFAYWGWGKYMDWVHNAQVKVASRRTYSAAGAVAATL
ncbi:Uncharacterized protein tam7 [Escovopsis weberi]|uniref:Uncharacterized protein tam7 n=1 Tax=Escovopsis weberi TaxID=150374 RepID=A0A0M8N5B6_ESCWE|nr:Uncharacterized protein tam7 [Escovopsis weberi]